MYEVIVGKCSSSIRTVILSLLCFCAIFICSFWVVYEMKMRISMEMRSIDWWPQSWVSPLPFLPFTSIECELKAGYILIIARSNQVNHLWLLWVKNQDYHSQGNVLTKLMTETQRPYTATAISASLVLESTGNVYMFPLQPASYSSIKAEFLVPSRPPVPWDVCVALKPKTYLVTGLDSYARRPLFCVLFIPCGQWVAFLRVNASLTRLSAPDKLELVYTIYC